MQQRNHHHKSEAVDPASQQQRWEQNPDIPAIFIVSLASDSGGLETLRKMPTYPSLPHLVERSVMVAACHCSFGLDTREEPSLSQRLSTENILTGSQHY